MESSDIVPHYESFKDMPVDKTLVHDTPIPGLRSRISTAIIFGLKDLKKSGIKTLLLLSKTSNTYIKSQDGLPGFFKVKHTSNETWFFELITKSAVLE